MSTEAKYFFQRFSCRVTTWLLALPFAMIGYGVVNTWLNAGMALGLVAAVLFFLGSGSIFGRVFCRYWQESANATEIPPLTGHRAPAAKAAKKPVADPKPEAASAKATETTDTPEADAKPAPQAQPDVLEAPRAGGADDLRQIDGIGPRLEKALNGLGIFHYAQIADWKPRHLRWIDDNLEGFKGRASRGKWIPQAKILANGAGTSGAGADTASLNGAAVTDKDAAP